MENFFETFTIELALSSRVTEQNFQLVLSRNFREISSQSSVSEKSKFALSHD